MVAKCFAKCNLLTTMRKTSSKKSMIRNQKHCFFTLLLVFVITNGLYLLSGYGESRKLVPFNEAEKLRRMNEDILQSDKDTGCDMPQMDAFSDVAMSSVKNTPKIVCEGVDWVECYHSKCSVTKEILNKMSDITCIYKEIVHISDRRYHIGEPVKISGNDTYHLNASDHVKVSCKADDKTGLGILSQRWFGYKAGLRPINMPKPPENRENTTDIMILCFDSTSRNGFIRKMPKSYKFLTEVLNATVMKSYNIVGDGSSSALYPILTGLELPEWETVSKDKGLDHKKLIFHTLKNDGYRTAFFEDMPWLGTFQKVYQGFDNTPTDHYLRSFLMEESTKGRKWYPGGNTRYCVGNVPTYGLLLNLTKQFLTSEGKHFCLTHIVDITHDDFNVISSADDDVVEFMKDFITKEMENTLLIVMGDHGAKLESYRQTYQGRIEERLPLLAIKLPKSLQKSRPFAQKFLEGNSEVLTSPYDLHTTLLDIVDLKKLANDYKVDGSKYFRGLSFLEDIPKSRSCGDAGILPHWCACSKWNNVRRTNPMYHQAATVLAEYIDNLTNERRSLCEKRTLTSIQSVLRMIPNSELSLEGRSLRENDHIYRGDIEQYQVKLTMGPGVAMFEASLTYYVKEDYFLINERDVTRINDYGDESSCIKDIFPQLSKYCYCKGKLYGVNYAMEFFTLSIN